MANLREGLCQLVTTAQLGRAPEKEKKSQLTRVRDFTERHSGHAHAALSALKDAARPGRDVFATALDAARIRSPQRITEAPFEAGGQDRRDI